MLGAQIVGTGLNNGPQQGAPTDLEADISAFALASAALAEQLAATVDAHATVVSVLQDSASNVGFLGVAGLGWGMLGGDSETVPTPAGLSATATGHATGTATVSAGFGLATSIAGNATATAALAGITPHSVDLAATARGSASVGATIVERHGCNALIQGSSTVTATAFEMTSLSAAPTGHATVSATSRPAYAFQAAPTGRASMAVSLRNAVPLAGTAHGRTVVTSSLRARILFAARLQGHGHMTVGVGMIQLQPIHLVGWAGMSSDVTITHHRMLTLLYSVGFKQTRTAAFTITGSSTSVTRPLIAVGSSPIEPVVVNYI